MRTVQFVLAFSCLLVFSQAKGYFGYRFYDVLPRTAEQCTFLQSLSLNEDAYDFLHSSRQVNQPARVMVNIKNVQRFEHILNVNQLEYKALNENFVKSLESDFALNDLLRNQKPYIRGEARLSTERYYTHNEINQYIEDLSVQYTGRVYIKTVGKSFEGRWMKTLTITNGDGRSNKNVIFMDGGFHAREWISPAAVIYATEQLVENFAENADLLKDYDWVILPVVNADGYEFTQTSTENRFWRKTRQPSSETCIGIDPNRNFDFHWNEEGASSNPCSNTYAGPYAFSEPETVVVRDILHTYAERGVMYLTVHSYGQYLLYPWGWSSDLPDNWEDQHEVAKAGADAIFAATGTNYTIGSSTNVLYIAAGASDDYAFNRGFTLSYTMELPAGGSGSFDPPPSSIDGIVKETWIGIRAMAKKAIEKYPLNN